MVWNSPTPCNPCEGAARMVQFVLRVAEQSSRMTGTTRQHVHVDVLKADRDNEPGFLVCGTTVYSSSSPLFEETRA